MKAGTIIAEEDLASAAKEAWEAWGGTQGELARLVDKSQASVAHALNSPERSLTSLRLDIIKACSGLSARGPLFELVDSDA